jgi:6-phosphogluconolactonase (cycloisomerase 2 family)
MNCIRKTVAATFAALVLASCGGGGGGGSFTATSSGPGMVFLAEGATLHAATITSTGYTETSSAAIPPDTLDPSHQIFGVIVHPNKQWIYVASADRRWGNARLNRFAVDWSTGALTYVDAVDLAASGAGPSCVDTNNCIPVGLGITDNGSRLIVEENSADTFLTYAIASDGSLAFVNEAARSITQLHGVGINAAGTYVYHGSKAYSRVADVITELGNDGTYGNASMVLTVGGVERLYTTLGPSESEMPSQVAVLSLADPANPALIAQAEPVPGGSGVVSIDVASNGNRVIAVGDSSIAVYDFDGTALTLRSQVTIASVRGRGVAFNADASLAVVSFQTGGAKLYTVAADGTLAEVAAVTSTNPTRAVVFSPRP